MAAALFRKNESQITKAWKQVLDEKDTTDWALFGYEGQTDVLRLISTGSQGLDELIMELNPGQVMYAFCRLLHPKTKLPTFISINWVGEGSAIERKASSAVHQFEVNKFFRYSSLSVHARAEEDVEPDSVLQQLARTAITKYDFSVKPLAAEESEHNAPVGTNYKAVKPQIDLKEKNKFWKQLEQEEQKQREVEMQRLKQMRQKEEKERLEHEERAAAVREQLIQQKEHQIMQKRLAELENRKQLKEEKEATECANLAARKAIASKSDTTAASSSKFRIEIPLKERESFWQRQEEDERARRNEELRRKDTDRKRMESEIEARGANARKLKESFDNLSRQSSQSCVITRKTNAFEEIEKERKKALEFGNAENASSSTALTEVVKNAEITEVVTSSSSHPLQVTAVAATPAIKRQQLQNNNDNKENQNGVRQTSDNHQNVRNGNGLAHLTEPNNLFEASRTNHSGMPQETNLDGQPDDDSHLSSSKQQAVPIQAQQLVEEEEIFDEDYEREYCLDNGIQNNNKWPSIERLAVIVEEEDEEEQSDATLKVLLAGKGTCARCLYDYEAADQEEMTFFPGDIIVHINKIFDTWWQGYLMGPDGEPTSDKPLLFPANFCEVIIE